ncbi:hypothetical protein AAMO2058_000232000 [Amorphochlora amoebiformis]
MPFTSRKTAADLIESKRKTNLRGMLKAYRRGTLEQFLLGDDSKARKKAVRSTPVSPIGPRTKTQSTQYHDSRSSKSSFKATPPRAMDRHLTSPHQTVRHTSTDFVDKIDSIKRRLSNSNTNHVPLKTTKVRSFVSKFEKKTTKSTSARRYPAKTIGHSPRPQSGQDPPPRPKRRAPKPAPKFKVSAPPAGVPIGLRRATIPARAHSTSKTTFCSRCQTKVSGRFCSNCGNRNF